MTRTWMTGWAAGLCLMLPALAPAQQGATAADAAVAIEAAWVEQDLQFTFVGFTNRYSCDAMRDKVHWYLEQLGVRPGFKVTMRGCPGASGPQFAPGLRVVAALPAPVAPGSAGAFPARPRQVVFKSDPTNVRLRDGDCELMERLLDQVFVPLGAKVVRDRTRCSPNQNVLGAVDMTLEVLEPVQAQ